MKTFFGMHDQLPKTITITIHYGEKLREITGKSTEETVVNENTSLILLISMLFKSYPEIEKHYLPGSLEFMINGKPPQEFDTLIEGDNVSLTIYK